MSHLAYHNTVFPRRCRERLVRKVSSWIKSFVSLTGPHLTVKVFSTKRALVEREEEEVRAGRATAGNVTDWRVSYNTSALLDCACSSIMTTRANKLYTDYWEAHCSSRERATSHACTVLPAELHKQRAPRLAEPSACCQPSALVKFTLLSCWISSNVANVCCVSSVRKSARLIIFLYHRKWSRTMSWK